jgi:hypothetical protein
VTTRRAIDDTNASLKSVQEQRTANCVDLDIIVEIKQGQVCAVPLHTAARDTWQQVEVSQADIFEPMYDSAVYLNKEVIEELNAQTRKLGQAKVEEILWQPTQYIESHTGCPSSRENGAHACRSPTGVGAQAT